MKLLRKISIAILSATAFSLSLAVIEYTSSMNRQDDGSYFTISALFVLYFFYSAPIYLIGGIPYSYFVDAYFEKVTFHNAIQKYTAYVLIYIVGGLVIVGLLFLITFLIDGDVSGLRLSNTFIVGVLASLLFLHISLILTKIAKSYRDRKNGS